MRRPDSHPSTLHRPFRREHFTEVTVIGNGPAGLSVSAFLSGLSPVYDSSHPHPDSRISQHLQKRAFLPLIEQDLSWYADSFDGSMRPMSSLYDSLARPFGDAVRGGLKDQPSTCLRWKVDPSRAVPHFVIGATPVGGSWNEYDPEMVAVSMGGWLDLPGFSVAQWMGNSRPTSSRLPASMVVSYMRAYVKALGIESYMRDRTRVISIERGGDDMGRGLPDPLWFVNTIGPDGEETVVISRYLLLAAGKMRSRRLQVEGEAEFADHIAYDIPAMRAIIERTYQSNTLNEAENPSSSEDTVVVVVGDGVSAADAVRICLQRGERVLHIVRKSDKELRSSMLSRLSPTAYPEYNEVFRLMTGRIKNPLYERRSSASIQRISGGSSGECVAEIKLVTGIEKVRFSVLAACIGKVDTLAEMMGDNQEFSFGADYTCNEDPTLFSVGSLAGDHFVRFLIGGCFQVTQHILRDYRACLSPMAPCLTPPLGSDVAALAEILRNTSITDADLDALLDGRISTPSCEDSNSLPSCPCSC